MLARLTQIIATFLSIGATFIAAYIVYLYSSSTKIEENIHKEGLEIFSELISAPTYENIFSYTVLGPSLIKKYQTKYPDKSRVYIYERIAADLVNADVFNESKNMLTAGEWGNPHGVVGRTFFWLIEKSIDHLVPEEVYWPSRGRIKSLSYPPETAQVELFPVGSIAVEQWVHDSKIILNYLKFLFLYKKYFIADLEQFIEKSEDGYKQIYKKYDYKNWLLEMEKVISKIEIHNYRINILLQLKKSYSINERLPSLKWIVFLGIGAFILGILLPLIFLAFHYEHVPTTINLVIGACAFVFLIGGASLLGKDIMSYYRDEYRLKYLIPFKKQLINHKTNNQFLFFDVTLTNQMIQLIDNKEIKQTKEFTKILNEYRDTLKASNICSEKLADILSDEIKRSVVLKSYLADPLSGGRHINILGPLWPEKRKSLLEELSNPDVNFTILEDYEGMTTEILKIKTPKTKEQINKLNGEIIRIYDKYGNLQEFQSCMATRGNLEKLRNMLIEMVN